MARIALNDDELGLLAGLSHFAIALYLVLRQRMDYTTGIVGKVAKISWQGLQESLYVEPHQGIQGTGTPDKSRTRRAAGELERAGLLRQEGSRNEKTLFFYLLCADTDNNVQNKADTKPTRGEPINTPVYKVVHRQAGIHPVSGKPLSTPPPPLRTQPVYGGEGGGIISKAEDQNPDINYVWPNCIQEEQKPPLKNRLARCPGAQTVLDELEGAMRRGGIKFPIRYLDLLIKKAIAGEFIAEAGLDVKRGREIASANALAKEKSLQAITSEMATHGQKPVQGKTPIPEEIAAKFSKFLSTNLSKNPVLN